MKFGLIGAEHDPTVRLLWAYCFESHEPFYSWYFREYYRRENTLGALENGKLLSCLQLIPYKIFLRGKVFNTSYIVGVASLPEARRGGLVGQLLKASLEEMDKREQAVSLLMPFKGQFYYPYQWSFCYYHYKYTIPLEELKSVAKTYGCFLPVQDKKEIPQLNKVYNIFVGGKNGYILRSSENWRLLLEEHLGEKGYTYLLQEADSPQGYILYYLKDNKFIVREMAYTSFKAQKALLQFIYNHRSQVEMLDWHAPINDYIHFFLPDPQKGITLYPFLMARIVNVKRALTALSYPQAINQVLVIKVEDDLASWNDQTFSWQIKNEKAEIEVVDHKPQLIISVDALSQLYFGTVGAQELYCQERLKVTDEKYVKLLTEIFPCCNNYINEYY